MANECSKLSLSSSGMFLNMQLVTAVLPSSTCIGLEAHRTYVWVVDFPIVEAGQHCGFAASCDEEKLVVARKCNEGKVKWNSGDQMSYFAAWTAILLRSTCYWLMTAVNLFSHAVHEYKLLPGKKTTTTTDYIKSALSFLCQPVILAKYNSQVSSNNTSGYCWLYLDPLLSYQYSHVSNSLTQHFIICSFWPHSPPYKRSAERVVRFPNIFHLQQSSLHYTLHLFNRQFLSLLRSLVQMSEERGSNRLWNVFHKKGSRGCWACGLSHSFPLWLNHIICD